MARPRTSLIEFKGMTLPVLSVTLHSLHVDALAQAAQKLFGDDAFFDDDAAVLELDKLANDAALEHADWPAISRLLKQHGLRVVGVRGAQESLRESATAAGLPCFAALNRAPPVELPQPAVVSETDSEVVPEATLTSESDAAPEPAAAPQNEAAAPPASAPTTGKASAAKPRITSMPAVEVTSLLLETSPFLRASCSFLGVGFSVLSPLSSDPAMKKG